MPTNTANIIYFITMVFVVANITPSSYQHPSSCETICWIVEILPYFVISFSGIICISIIHCTAWGCIHIGPKWTNQLRSPDRKLTWLFNCFIIKWKVSIWSDLSRENHVHHLEQIVTPHFTLYCLHLCCHKFYRKTEMMKI